MVAVVAAALPPGPGAEVFGCGVDATPPCLCRLAASALSLFCWTRICRLGLSLLILLAAVTWGWDLGQDE